MRQLYARIEDCYDNVTAAGCDVPSTHAADVCSSLPYVLVQGRVFELPHELEERVIGDGIGSVYRIVRLDVFNPVVARGFGDRLLGRDFFGK